MGLQNGLSWNLPRLGSTCSYPQCLPSRRDELWERAKADMVHARHLGKCSKHEPWACNMPKIVLHEIHQIRLRKKCIRQDAIHPCTLSHQGLGPWTLSYQGLDPWILSYQGLDPWTRRQSTLKVDDTTHQMTAMVAAMMVLMTILIMAN